MVTFAQHFHDNVDRRIRDASSSQNTRSSAGDKKQITGVQTNTLGQPCGDPGGALQSLVEVAARSRARKGLTDSRNSSISSDTAESVRTRPAHLARCHARRHDAIPRLVSRHPTF
jgi:hypothetical protein